MTLAAIDKELASLQETVIAIRSGELSSDLFLKLRRIREQQDGWLDVRIKTMKQMRGFHV